MDILRKNKVLLILGGILLLAAFLRIYRINEYMTFLGDEGRDALVVKQILEGHFTLLGPRASAGDFFSGPIYYYLITPALLLSWYDPIGPAIMIALLSVLTVYLIYRFGKEWFGVRAGIIAASLYAVSPLVITYSRSSWNPNPMPFFSLIILYLLQKALVRKSRKLFFIIGILYGIAFQLHYIETVLGVIIFFFVLFGSILLFRDNVKKFNVRATLVYLRSIVMRYLLLFAGFIIGFSPFLAFELRHSFANTKTIIAFILGKNEATDPALTHAKFFDILGDVFFRLFGHLITRFPPPVIFHQYTDSELTAWRISSIAVAVIAVFFLLRVKNKLTLLLFAFWLFFGVVLFGFYTKNIYDYYFEFMFPLPFLLVGNALGEGLSSLIKKKWVIYVGFVLAIALFLFNLYDLPFNYSSNRQKEKAENAATFIISKTGDKPFNFALITKSNSDHAYRYFFHIKNHDPVTIDNNINDPKRASVTDQLFVICDFKNCSPLGYSIIEVAGFGRANIANTWDLPDSEVTVFKLVHYKGDQ
jgi:4-amino-4-deoxy-L-arabinose transferase-like glycosyltransferase